jgi:hypothetical protein
MMVGFWSAGLGASAIPDSEDFEHNDLTGKYGGDTGSHDIQTSTVYEGSYALFGDGNGSFVTIVRDSDAFERYGLRVTWKEWDPDTNGNGGLALATSVTGYDNMDGYYAYSDPRNSNFSFRRVDGGSTTTLDSANPNLTGQSWVECQLDLLDDGTIELSREGNTLSAADENYTSVKLGFMNIRGVYIDDVQFSEL